MPQTAAPLGVLKKLTSALIVLAVVLTTLAMLDVSTARPAAAQGCPAEFDHCDGTGMNDGCHAGNDLPGLLSSCNPGGTGGGSGGGWEPPAGVWVNRTSTYTAREWSAYPNQYPDYTTCNQDWENMGVLSTWIRSIIEGRPVRNVQHRNVCTRVPKADGWCTYLICPGKPYAWSVSREWRYDIYLS